jgi:hypothetical protein
MSAVVWLRGLWLHCCCGSSNSLAHRRGNAGSRGKARCLHATAGTVTCHVTEHEACDVFGQRLLLTEVPYKDPQAVTHGRGMCAM